jgi:membrane-associated phospholipid phosphatase
MTYIGVSFFTAIVLFAIFPNGQDLRPDIATLGRENIFTRAIAVLYQADTNTNVCPSLHVVGSMAAVFGILHHPRLRCRWWLPVGGIVLAVLICLSTVFIKQHSVMDVFVGIPYGFLMYGLVYWLPLLWKKCAPSSITPPVSAEK